MIAFYYHKIIKHVVWSSINLINDLVILMGPIYLTNSLLLLITCLYDLAHLE